MRIDGGRNVTIRNAKIRGYKIAILARGTRDLRLLDNDLSFNWKPRLYSLIEHESLRAAIIVDEWSPYDWQSPILWPVNSSRRNPLPLRVLGPAGPWRVVAQRGIAPLSRSSGRMNDTIIVTPRDTGDWRVELESRGRRFSYARFEPPMRWGVNFYTWPDSLDPRKDSLMFSRLVTRTPIASQQTPRLDYMWYRTRFARSVMMRPGCGWTAGW